ncbi:MAG: hypothetical protein QW255_05420 [Candidatus Bilamarchaeaceae archaeon]
MLLEDSIFPAHWAEDFKKDFKKELEKILNESIKPVVEQYMIGSLYKVSLNTPSRNILKDITKTLALERMIDVGLPEPPYLPVFVVGAIGGSYIYPGMKIYEEGKTYMYLFPERPRTIKNYLEDIVEAKLYFTDEVIGSMEIDIIARQDVLGDRGNVSRVFAFYLTEKEGVVSYENFIPYTNNILEYYDTFQEENAKDILVLSSYGDYVRIYMSRRIRQRYANKKIRMMFLNYPKRNIDAQYWKNHLENLDKNLPVILKYRSADLYASNVISEEKNKEISILKSIPKIASYNGTIRSVSDIATLFYLINRDLVKEVETMSISRTSSMKNKKAYIVPFILHKYENNNKIDWRETIIEIYRKWNKSLPKIRIGLIRPEQSLDYSKFYKKSYWEGYEDIFEYWGIRKNEFTNNDTDVIFPDLYELLSFFDLFFVELLPLQLNINYTIESENENVSDKVINNILSRYEKTIHNSIDFDEIVKLISSVKYVHRVENFEVRAKSGNRLLINTFDLIYKYPYSEFANQDSVYKLISDILYVYDTTTNIYAFEYIDSIVFTITPSAESRTGV